MLKIYFNCFFIEEKIQSLEEQLNNYEIFKREYDAKTSELENLNVKFENTSTELTQSLQTLQGNLIAYRNMEYQ